MNPPGIYVGVPSNILCPSPVNCVLLHYTGDFVLRYDERNFHLFPRSLVSYFLYVEISTCSVLYLRRTLGRLPRAGTAVELKSED